MLDLDFTTREDIISAIEYTLRTLGAADHCIERTRAMYPESTIDELHELHNDVHDSLTLSIEAERDLADDFESSRGIPRCAATECTNYVFNNGDLCGGCDDFDFEDDA